MCFKRNSMLIVIILLIVSFFVLSGGIDYFFRTEEPNTLPKNAYRIAYDNTWYPLKLYDKEEYLSLFSEDILKSIAKQEKFSVQFIQNAYVALFNGLDNGNYEGILSAELPHKEQTEKYVSSDSYYFLGPVLLTTTSSAIKSLKDLKEKKIGIIAGADSVLPSSPQYVSTNFISYDYHDRFKMIDDLMNGTLDGMLVDMMKAHEYTRGLYQKQLRINSLPLGNKGLRLIAKNNKAGNELIRKSNEGLKTIEHDELYSQLVAKWGLYNPRKIRDQLSAKKRG